MVLALQVHTLLAASLNGPVHSSSASMDFKWNTIIKPEIDAQRVVCASIVFPGGGRHEVIIWGYCEDNNVRTVQVQDPWYDPIPQSYSEFVTNYRSSGGRCIEFNVVR